jgi:hypothetical protein
LPPIGPLLVHVPALAAPADGSTSAPHAATILANLVMMPLLEKRVRGVMRVRCHAPDAENPLAHVPVARARRRPMRLRYISRPLRPARSAPRGA